MCIFAPGKHEHKSQHIKSRPVSQPSCFRPIRFRSLKNTPYFRAHFHGDLAFLFFLRGWCQQVKSSHPHPQSQYESEGKKKVSPCFSEPFLSHNSLLFNCFFLSPSLCCCLKGKVAMSGKSPDNWQLLIKALMTQSLWLLSSGSIICALTIHSAWLVTFREDDSALVRCPRRMFVKTHPTTLPLIWVRQILCMWNLLEAQTLHKTWC